VFIWLQFFTASLQSFVTRTELFCKPI